MGLTVLMGLTLEMTAKIPLKAGWLWRNELK
jgi:hypothetical protein